MKNLRRLIEASAVEINLVDKGQHCERYALGEIWELNYKEIREAIDETPTVNAIPAEWITDWLTKQSIPATSYGIDCSAIHKMLDDWEKENELDKT